MNTAAAHLGDLAKKLAHKQNELDRIRRAFDTRLATLQRRKDNLQSDLQRVESEIEAAAAQQSSSLAVAVPAAPPTAAAEPTTLPLFLISVVKELARPVTVAELTRELVKRKFPTKSTDLSKLIANRVHDMLRKGYLARPAGGEKGVVLGKGTPVRGRPGRKPRAAGQPAANGAKGKRGPKKQRFSLRSLLTDLLGASDHPMKAKELAQKALQAGYKTKSKNFIDNVWTALGSMDNIVNIQGEGYRLK
jgi:hypothetical protein